MSKYEQCPKCGKKGWYTVYGYDPNPEKGPMKRCKYCRYSIRTRDKNRMEFYTVNQAADELGLRPDQVNALCSLGFFGQKVSNVWLITGKELEYYEQGEIIPKDEKLVLYDAATAIKELGISRARFYRMVAREEIEVLRFGNRGGNPNIVVTEDQLDAAGKMIGNGHEPATKQVDADQYIYQNNGRFYVKGTYTEDPLGEERNYKTLTSARAKAREAYGQSPLIKQGETFPFDGNGKVITIKKDVTPIDGMVLVDVDGHEFLWPLQTLIDLIGPLSQ